jgi:hypothetical protein
MDRSSCAVPAMQTYHLSRPHNSPAADLPLNECEIRVYIVLVKLRFRS